MTGECCKGSPLAIRTGDGAPPTALRALECLKALALEQGLDDVSMRDVARRLGLSLAALQYHYPNKAALLEAFVERTVQTYRDEIDALLAACPPGERLASLVRFAAGEALAGDRYRVLAMIEARASHDQTARRAIGAFQHSYLAVMRDAAQADAPDEPADAALLRATLVAAMLEGLPGLLEAAGILGAERTALVELAVAMARAGPRAAP